MKPDVFSSKTLPRQQLTEPYSTIVDPSKPTKGTDMAKKLDLSKSVHDLVEEYPEVSQVMYDLGFTDIVKPMALSTVGRVMTIPKGAAIKDIDLDLIVKTFEEKGFEVSTGGERPAAVEATPESQPAAAPDADDRSELLKSYVERLSAGEPLEQVRADFVANFQNVDAAEIARAEQDLIEAGAKIDDVQRLCDVHSALFHGRTTTEQAAGDDLQAPAPDGEQAVLDSLMQGDPDARFRELAETLGHPLNVFSRENAAIAAQVERTRAALGTPEETSELAKLSQLGIHYAKKGDLLYPPLKVNHDFSGPSDVMWGVDDEIRADLGALLRLSDHDDAWRERARAVIQRADEMTYKEQNILLPLCAQNFTDEEWLQTYADMKGYDLCLIEDTGAWEEGERWTAEHAGNAVAQSEGAVSFPTGSLTPAQLDALLNTLPLELSFVDDQNINRWWNDDGKKKLFKRPNSALGREVFTCHPPKIEKMVRGIIAAFRAGERDSVEVWMQKEGEPVLVRYMAVRDREGSYVGTLEVVQRMAFAQEHFSQK